MGVAQYLLIGGDRERNKRRERRQEGSVPGREASKPLGGKPLGLMGGGDGDGDTISCGVSDADLRKLFDRLDTDHSAPPTARVRAAPGGGAG